MNTDHSHRQLLSDLIAARGESYLSISTLLGRNAAYVQQFIKRGSPRKLDEDDRHILAAHFGIDEMLLRPSRVSKSNQ
jgi:hypothetical protein